MQIPEKVEQEILVWSGFEWRKVEFQLEGLGTSQLSRRGRVKLDAGFRVYVRNISCQAS